MKQRTLGPATSGTSLLATSAVGFGCMGLSQGYGPIEEDTAISVIHRAIDLGVTMFDTAMSYGQGANERLLARALAGQRDTVHIATKFGITRDQDGVRLDAHPDRVEAYCDASLV